MFECYRRIAKQYPKISFAEERRLIARAKKGSRKSAEEIVLRHIGFVIFRLHKKIFPELLNRFGEELISESIVILYQKIKTYNLNYCDKQGNAKPVKFVSYVWKRVDGFLIDKVKKELQTEKRPSASGLRNRRYSNDAFEDDETDKV